MTLKKIVTGPGCPLVLPGTGEWPRWKEHQAPLSFSASGKPLRPVLISRSSSTLREKFTLLFSRGFVNSQMGNSRNLIRLVLHSSPVVCRPSPPFLEMGQKKCDLCSANLLLLQDKWDSGGEQSCIIRDQQWTWGSWKSEDKMGWLQYQDLQEYGFVTKVLNRRATLHEQHLPI